MEVILLAKESLLYQPRSSPSTDQRQTEPLMCSPMCYLYMLDLLTYRLLRKEQMVNKHKADLTTVLLSYRGAFQK